MSTTTFVRAITLAIAVALAAIAVNLQADIAPPLFSAEAAVVAESATDDAAAGTGSYPAELAINWQLCPC